MFDDTGHRPHADFKGQEPQTRIDVGPEALSVELVMWAPQHHMDYVYNALQANWGDRPSRVVQDGAGRFWDRNETPPRELSDAEFSAMCNYVVKCFEGGTLPQILEEFRFHFVIDGVTRACTHQLVRTRGADVMQHGGRDNDWRMRGWTMPETIHRACEAGGQERGLLRDGLRHCITDWKSIDDLLDLWASALDFPRRDASLRGVIDDYLSLGKKIYSALVDAGIPWQDARRLLWMGTQTYLHIGYNYLDLMRTLAGRLEHIMDWEYNCVAQLMVREVRMKCPRYMGDPLMSVSDKAKQAMFAGLTSWPPDGKWPIPAQVARCKTCGEPRENHHANGLCSTGAGGWDPVDILPRTHRPEQMPFWVLAPESMDGAPIRWIPTNGTFPEEARL